MSGYHEGIRTGHFSMIETNFYNLFAILFTMDTMSMDNALHIKKKKNIFLYTKISDEPYYEVLKKIIFFFTMFRFNFIQGRHNMSSSE